MFLLQGYIKRELYSVMRQDLVMFIGICQVIFKKALTSFSLHLCLNHFYLITGLFPGILTFFVAIQRRLPGILSYSSMLTFNMEKT